jgi:HEAT repeat protein
MALTIEVQAQFDRWVEDLAVKHRERAAFRALMAAGMAATPAVRRGLLHREPVVRARCCDVLDHFMDADALPELMANLTHADERVRGRALHALACDKCKEGACRPGEEDVLPIAIRMLQEDGSRFVRSQAAGLVGPAVHRSAEACQALERARDGDPDPLVRKIAGWYAPGGSIYRRVRPKPPHRGQRVPRAPR